MQNMKVSWYDDPKQLADYKKKKKARDKRVKKARTATRKAGGK